jgi:FkbM family methyltransferase
MAGVSTQQETREPFGTFAPDATVRGILNRTRRAGESWLARRAAFLLRRLAIRRLDGKPVDTEALGARMRLYPYNNVCEKRILFTPQFFDAEELETLRSRFREGFVFLDVGANIGGYSLFVAAHAGPGARVLALEPQPAIYQRLVFNLRLNDFPTVKAVACAVADKDGDLTLFISNENQGESSVKIMAGGSAGARITVPARRLLALIQEEGFTRVDAAKLDTEGAEDIILDTFFSEAPEALWPRLLIIERGSARWHADVPGLLATKGYKVLRETRNNLIWERD